MRKTRSQTQAENALLSENTVNKRTNVGVTSASHISSAATLPASTTKHSRSTTNTNLNNNNITTTNVAQKRHAPPNDMNTYIYRNNLRDYENTLELLRVFELQQILSLLNISFVGRKADLQCRIRALLHSHFELVAPKIDEVSSQQGVYPKTTAQYPKRMYSAHMQMPHAVQPNGSALMGVNANANAVAIANNQHQHQQQQVHQQLTHATSAAAAVAAAAATAGVPPFMHAISTQVPTHPDVRLKKLAFYDVLNTLIKPSSLIPRTTQRIQEASFLFTLTPQQATEIASNRDIRNASKIEHVIQVQLRFCLLETSCDQEDCFPPSLSVKVNSKLCQLPNIIPTNRQNVEPKRPPRPINVTSNVKLSPTVANQIVVQWCPDYTRSYCLAVYLVKKLTSAQLLQRMKVKGVKPADYTRALIKEKLTEDADCEIATTMLKVSLNCPLGKMKMSIPCRASTCSHLQCFDANLYLQMNERKPTWNCPVCDKPAIYDNLVIDGYFQEVLASPLLKTDEAEIQLHKDGSWSTHSLRNDTQVVDTPTRPIEKVEVIADDIELITTEDVKPVKTAATNAIPNDQPTSTTNSDTVDLTLTDSDDDLPLAKCRPSRQNGGSTTTTAAATSSTTVVNTAADNSTTNVSTVSSSLNGGGGGNGAVQRGGMFMPPIKNDVSENVITLDDSNSSVDSPVRKKTATEALAETGVSSTTIKTDLQIPK